MPNSESTSFAARNFHVSTTAVCSSQLAHGNVVLAWISRSGHVVQ